MENFRCFREKQTVRLAPLTLLVGENSTGKTSFLGLLRALHDGAHTTGIPDFNAPPFDLGSFRQIVSDGSGVDSPTDSFSAGLETRTPEHLLQFVRAERMKYEARFRAKGSTSTVSSRRITVGSAWLEQEFDEARNHLVRLGTDSGEWRVTYDSNSLSGLVLGQGTYSFAILALEVALKEIRDKQDELSMISVKGADRPSAEDWEQFEGIGKWASWHLGTRSLGPEGLHGRNQIYAGGPIRSVPKRTYNPANERSGPYGEHVPAYLAALAATGSDDWLLMRELLERVGRVTDLFERLDVNQYGEPNAGPFQLLVGIDPQGQGAALRNLVDVGYGVGQVLPLVTELLWPEQRDAYLLQQPEVHLHPRAQAGLGSLFCGLASEGRQLIVETHSDHLMNRIRMEVRDGEIGLKPEDVSLLYFERDGPDVRIHEIRFDAQGNVCGAPESYREFFRLESRRSLGL